jgi:hypothetical protein
VDAAFMPSQRLAARVDHEYRPTPGHLPNALDPGFHRVRTQWIRGFMAFQPIRRTRIVLLVVPE